MINIPTQAISFNMFYGGLSSAEILAEGTSIKKAKGEIPGVTVETPRFKNISIKNITCKGALQAAFLEGLPEMNLENITLENIDIEAENGFECHDANGLSIKGLRLNTHNSPAIQLINSRNIDIEKLEVPKNQNTNIEIKGALSKNITIRSVNTLNENKIIIGKEVNQTTVKVY
jgi:hypothetical protein